MDTDIDPPPDATADPAEPAEPVEDAADPPRPGTAAYATAPRGVATVRILAPRVGDHDRMPAPEEVAPDDGIARPARGRSAGRTPAGWAWPAC